MEVITDKYYMHVTFAFCLTAPNHNLNNVELSSVSSRGIHLSAILQETPQASITEIIWENTYIRFDSNLPVANGLTSWMLYVVIYHIQIYVYDMFSETTHL